MLDNRSGMYAWEGHMLRQVEFMLVQAAFADREIFERYLQSIKCSRQEVQLQSRINDGAAKEVDWWYSQTVWNKGRSYQDSHDDNDDDDDDDGGRVWLRDCY